MLAVLVSAVLVGMGLWVSRTVSRAWQVSARGLGAGFVVAAREQLRGPTAPDAATLEKFVDEHRSEGLRYVGLISNDGKGVVLAQAGTAKGETLELGSFSFVAGRARLVSFLPRRDRVAGAPEVSPSTEPAARATPGEPAARPAGAPDRTTLVEPAARPALLVYEFTPLIANQLRSDARMLIVVMVVASLVLIGLALWVLRGTRVRERLLLELERGRRLAALGEMSAVLAHELRNPLASLKGHAQLLVEALEDGGAPRKKADRVVNESVRLETLANDLLEFVRTGELHRAPTEPGELVRGAVSEVGAERFTVEVAEGLGKPALDGARLRMALTNVLRNAAQASPEGRVAEVRVGRDGGAVTVVVRDHGGGIPAGEEKAIFEPFHTKRVRGVGLGLAIARRIVELHGGTIEARNHKTGGAELTISLPEQS
ncbi:MAG: HAMP domain-containing histidine kinase [Deltaproteobacteria bacterium]|nr:HAMP domain-containing histidine kinase [Deltaproteobacteria bacterium]